MNDLPFGEEVFAEVRKNVMKRVTRPRRFVAAWALAATATVIAIVLLLIPRREELPLNAPPHRVAQAFQPTPPYPPEAQVGKPAPHDEAKKHHHKQPAVTEEPLRIELTTNDPDVRIIWITDRRTHEETGNDVPGLAAGDGRRSR